ncbi:phospholipid carrier-dependent glycosyltransferase [Streptomyces sp. A7024]|uniref:Polyprenol-phosphate-mannose--protein mannosyltransferase n=1 Tax=Streptomyces coryli TaxID=1128680 RepID=A0A6G4UB31_9ACTN|nr:phospholipid carrier-dependent glycosyltransferase [Streptomyces coryli]NGN69384.1 phospholipid carrier-dependent glycosyltransferase [Streptomyces coryli]
MARVSSDTATEPKPRQADASQPWRRRLRGFGYAARPQPSVTERLVPPYPEPSGRVWAALGVGPARAEKLSRASGWLGPILVALFAGLMRFWHLGQPRAVIFDETYYAKDAWSLLKFGYEGNWPKNANDKILDIPQQIPLSHEASYVVHPPVGKWMIAVGEWMFGLNPFGWRFAMAVLGTLSVLMLCRIGRRLFRSTLLGCLAGGLMAVDGLHFVMSRAALLDLVVMFWVLAAFGCLLIDRDKVRERLAAALPRSPDDGRVRPDADVAQRLGLGWRPWRLAAGVCLGLACATKWNGLYILAAFGLLTVLWDVGARRTAGAGQAYRTVLRRDAGPAFLSLVPVAVVVYVASWAGWFASGNGYFRNWADGRSTSYGWIPGPLRSLWHYHSQVYDFHVGLTSGHTYQSNPWSWLILGRPVSYFWDDPKPGTDGCASDASQNCAREVLALGTPLLWWLACAALVYAVWRWALRRDWRAGAIVCGVAAGWVPWLMYQERTIFYFYAVVFVPFLCLAVAMLLAAIAGPPSATERRRTLGVVMAGVLVLLIVWNFIYFFPIYTGQTIPREAWQARMWLGSWV